MGTHNVYLTLKEAELKDTTTIIQIKKNNKKSGRIEFNKNSLVYYPKGAKQGYDVYWSELEEAIISYCKNRGRKRSLMLVQKNAKTA